MTVETTTGHELATVWTTATGAPERLLWASRRFVVVARPIPWIDRISWWEHSPRVPAGEAAQVLERQMWQVQVRALDTGELLIVDLSVAEGPQWPITAVFD
ncbi:MAG: DUF6504 family protein [Nesterenkonia sp.]|uniref:DUF6504 family protein n=1 Tax=Nesterenkonia marinintestina TaxID=2979865 RepID=UPI0021C0EE24|nr:DUF6504 family protein [Nesterenkonia sp. GX14115]MDO5493596.1 DUF6504 family protein [Nesterenkonia sp.]